MYRGILHHSDLTFLGSSVIFCPQNQEKLIMKSGTILKRVTWPGNKVTTVKKVGSEFARQSFTYSYIL